MAQGAADHKPSYNTETLVDLIRNLTMAEQLKVAHRLGVDPDVLPKGLNRKARRSRKAPPRSADQLPADTAQAGQAGSAAAGLQ
jgi:hypothetical protein